MNSIHLLSTNEVKSSVVNIRLDDAKASSLPLQNRPKLS